MTFFKIFCIVVLVATCAVYSEGHCRKCSENEFCDIIFWFFSRCIRFRVEGESCNYRHRICAKQMECRGGTCQSMFIRTKSSTTSLLPSTPNEFLLSSTMTIIQTEKPVAEIDSQSYDDDTNPPPVLRTSTEIPKTTDNFSTTILTKSSESQSSSKNSTDLIAQQTTITPTHEQTEKPVEVISSQSNDDDTNTPPVLHTSTEIPKTTDNFGTTVLTKFSENQPSSKNSTVLIAQQTTITQTQKHIDDSRILKRNDETDKTNFV